MIEEDLLLRLVLMIGCHLRSAPKPPPASTVRPDPWSRTAAGAGPRSRTRSAGSGSDEDRSHVLATNQPFDSFDHDYKLRLRLEMDFLAVVLKHNLVLPCFWFDFWHGMV